MDLAVVRWCVKGGRWDQGPGEAVAQHSDGRCCREFTRLVDATSSGAGSPDGEAIIGEHFPIDPQWKGRTSAQGPGKRAIRIAAKTEGWQVGQRRFVTILLGAGPKGQIVKPGPRWRATLTKAVGAPRWECQTSKPARTEGGGDAIEEAWRKRDSAGARGAFC